MSGTPGGGVRGVADESIVLVFDEGTMAIGYPGPNAIAKRRWIQISRENAPQFRVGARSSRLDFALAHPPAVLVEETMGLKLTRKAWTEAHLSSMLSQMGWIDRSQES